MNILFSPHKLDNLTLPNRIVIPPMCWRAAPYGVNNLFAQLGV